MYPTECRLPLVLERLPTRWLKSSCLSQHPLGAIFKYPEAPTARGKSALGFSVSFSCLHVTSTALCFWTRSRHPFLWSLVPLYYALLRITLECYTLIGCPAVTCELCSSVASSWGAWSQSLSRWPPNTLDGSLCAPFPGQEKEKVSGVSTTEKFSCPLTNSLGSSLLFAQVVWGGEDGGP